MTTILSSAGAAKTRSSPSSGVATPTPIAVMALLRRNVRRVIGIRSSSVELEVGRGDDEPRGAAQLLFGHARADVVDERLARRVVERRGEQPVAEELDRLLRLREVVVADRRRRVEPRVREARVREGVDEV